MLSASKCSMSLKGRKAPYEAVILKMYSFRGPDGVKKTCCTNDIIISESDQIQDLRALERTVRSKGEIFLAIT